MSVIVVLYIDLILLSTVAANDFALQVLESIPERNWYSWFMSFFSSADERRQSLVNSTFMAI